LPAPVSIAHACLGQTFFCLVVALAVLTGPAPVSNMSEEAVKKWRRLGILTLSFIFLQLVAGATLRHTGKGLHVHLTGAALVLIHVQLLARRVLQNFSIRTGLGKLSALMPVLVAVQLILGYIAWKTGPIILTTAHVGVGALIFAATTIAT